MLKFSRGWVWGLGDGGDGSVEVRGMGRVLEYSRELSRGGCCFVELGS